MQDFFAPPANGNDGGMGGGGLVEVGGAVPAAAVEVGGTVSAASVGTGVPDGPSLQSKSCAHFPPLR